MGVETLVGAGISAATSIGGALLSSSGSEKAAQAADEANNRNNQMSAQLLSVGTPYLLERAQAARDALSTGRTDLYNALVSGLARTDGLAEEWDTAYSQGSSALNNALAEWDSKYGQVRTDNQPYMTLGEQGVAGYSGLLKDPSSITTNPGYQFRLSQGTQTLDRSAAAKGKLFSGGAQAAQQQYGQDYASSEYDKALARYGAAMGVGQTAVGQVDSAGMATANGKSNVYNSLANLAMQRAQGKTGVGEFQAGLYQNAGQGMAGLQSQTAGLESQTGQNMVNFWTKVLGGAQESNTNSAQQEGQAYQNEANAMSKGLGGVGSAINSGISNYQQQQNFDKFVSMYKR